MIFWSKLGPITRIAARRITPRRPPVLVIGIGRSGTSWVGEVLGRAPDALYLREPITQSMLRLPAARRAALEQDSGALCRRWGDAAFQAAPVFPRPIVHFADQWRLGERRDRRLVVKEADPLLLPDLHARYAPRIVYLVRHPAGVALSARRLGLGPGYFKNRLLANAALMGGALRPFAEYLHSIRDPWEREGARQGAMLTVVREVLTASREAKVVLYENLCADPESTFRDLYGFCGLQWSADIEGMVAEKSGGGDRERPFETARDSKAVALSWREEIAQGDLDALRSGYRRFGLPWYRDDADWRCEPVEPARADRARPLARQAAS